MGRGGSRGEKEGDGEYNVPDVGNKKWFIATNPTDFERISEFWNTFVSS